MEELSIVLYFLLVLGESFLESTASSCPRHLSVSSGDLEMDQLFLFSKHQLEELVLSFAGKIGCLFFELQCMLKVCLQSPVLNL